MQSNQCYFLTCSRNNLLQTVSDQFQFFCDVNLLAQFDETFKSTERDDKLLPKRTFKPEKQHLTSILAVKNFLQPLLEERSSLFQDAHGKERLINQNYYQN